MLICMLYFSLSASATICRKKLLNSCDFLIFNRNFGLMAMSHTSTVLLERSLALRISEMLMGTRNEPGSHDSSMEISSASVISLGPGTSGAWQTFMKNFSLLLTLKLFTQNPNKIE